MDQIREGRETQREREDDLAESFKFFLQSLNAGAIRHARPSVLLCQSEKKKKKKKKKKKR
jgi:hypothetical protein